MGCHAGDFEEGRWQDINFWGNELTLHHGPDEVASKKRHDVEMGTVSVPHFGAHLSEEDFFSLKDRIEDSKDFDYFDKPYRRFVGKDREQETYLHLKGINGRKMWSTWDTMHDLLERGAIDVERVLTHRMSIDSFPEAVELAIAGDCGKVVLDF